MQIGCFIKRCIVHVHELQHFAFGNDVGGVSQHLHDAHAARLHHHLERAGVKKVAHQNTGRVTEIFVGSGAAAPQCGLVHHIVVQQSGCVNELHHGGQSKFMGFLVAQCATGEQQNNRAQAFAPR